MISIIFAIFKFIAFVSGIAIVNVCTEYAWKFTDIELLWYHYCVKTSSFVSSNAFFNKYFEHSSCCFARTSSFIPGFIFFHLIKNSHKVRKEIYKDETLKKRCTPLVLEEKELLDCAGNIISKLITLHSTIEVMHVKDIKSILSKRKEEDVSYVDLSNLSLQELEYLSHAMHMTIEAGVDQEENYYAILNAFEKIEKIPLTKNCKSVELDALENHDFNAYLLGCYNQDNLQFLIKKMKLTEIDKKAILDEKEKPVEKRMRFGKK